MTSQYHNISHNTSTTTQDAMRDILSSMTSQLYGAETVTCILKPINDLTEDGDIVFRAALVTLTQIQITIHVNNFTDHSYTLKRASSVANFSVLTPEQMKYVRPIDPVTTLHLLQNKIETAAFYESSLLSLQNLSNSRITTCFPHQKILAILSITS